MPFVKQRDPAWVEAAHVDDDPKTKLDPHGPLAHGFNLRLNDYELALVQEVARLERRSRTSAMKGVMIPALQRRLVELRAAEDAVPMTHRRSHRNGTSGAP